MATKLWRWVTFTSLCFFSETLSINPLSNLNQWCSQTPYPDPCKYYMTQNAHHFAPTNAIEFQKMAVQIAMEQAFQAWQRAMQFGSKCQTEQEKAAWSDCLKLYHHTVLQLNRTLHPNTKCSKFDVQTWLSTALTNLDTCRAGAAELGVLDFMLPLVSNDVSQLISNCLAIYRSLKEGHSSDEGFEFPSWVSSHDRKLLQSSISAAEQANLVVAGDGSGDFRTIKEALDASVNRRDQSVRFIIHVKSGVYRENIEIDNNLNNVMLVGDGLRNTIITGDRSVGGGTTSFNSATVGIMGDKFIARDITFRNTAGPQNHQAVALRSGSDQSIFYRCSIQGYQDTLFVQSQRQFYKQCYIFGTVDIIFGNAAVVFQNCVIYVRRPINGQVNVITAQGRGDPNQNTGISIQNSRVMAARDLKPVLNSFKTYLGRPWQQYSRTVYLKTFLDTLIDPAGWLEWDYTSFGLDTLYYGEYRNYGPASSIIRRVKWPGFREIRDPNEASKFTVDKFIVGQTWLPATGVPFTAGL
ncbi:hypothetical protein F0562_031364 [Nyssa sinensis]|uniref:Pectinesterase n=1 Tax=Nyssa sinensis TaxID=561372 RepID=A0A5J5AWH8_9ASTE|nr:hypothetical protein F0562_031364 [Nyssa sinensis]